ncbi:MAG: hypothetical protein B7Z35_05230 [Hydrogenophilales bacterium 12-61-10]|nr:MAG: hypothetical protein B7Z35_05230 [Hydrogenophilales bacterium 12-61-10]
MKSLINLSGTACAFTRLQSCTLLTSENFSMKKIVSALILTGLVGAPGVVMAEEAASPHTLSANVGMYSNYVFRGISQTGGDPALQGGLDYTHSSGFYLGTWGWATLKSTCTAAIAAASARPALRSTSARSSTCTPASRELLSKPIPPKSMAQWAGSGSPSNIPTT